MCKASFSCAAVEDSLANILHFLEEERTDILLVERILDVPHHMSISRGRGESFSIKCTEEAQQTLPDTLLIFIISCIWDENLHM